jgi:hypothetical protein
MWRTAINFSVRIDVGVCDTMLENSKIIKSCNELKKKIILMFLSCKIGDNHNWQFQFHYQLTECICLRSDGEVEHYNEANKLECVKIIVLFTRISFCIVCCDKIFLFIMSFIYYIFSTLSLFIVYYYSYSRNFQ